MVSKREDRPNEGYRVRVTLPKPWGRVGPWQTGFRSRRQAEQVEAWLREQALERPELIDALVAGRFSLRDAWVAKLRGQLGELLAGVSDPLLTDAVAAYREECRDPRARAGLDQLLEYADDGVRLSWLRGRNITRVYRAAVRAGRKPNSVRRGLHRAVRGLLASHLDDAAVARRFQRVEIPSAVDTREVRVTGEEVRTLVEHCEPDSFRWLVVAAIATAVDQGPLLALTPRDIRDEEGVVAIPDTKTPHRRRELRVSGVALMAFRLAAKGREPDERIWPWSKDQVRHLWESARDAAAGRPQRGQRKYWAKHKGHLTPHADPVGERARELLEQRRVVTLPLLRFKDLRHLLPTLLAAMGKDRREIQALLGHAPGSKQTDRYITPVGDVAALDDAAERLGLTRINLRAVGE